MAKKHRVKRQKYVEHLLVLEKKREDYLEKRRIPKRSREARNNEEVTGAGRDAMESTVLKKRRTETGEAERNASDEEADHQLPPSRSIASSSANTAAAAEKAKAATASPQERKAFFAAQPFDAVVKASAAATTEKGSSAAPAKKSLKRRHY